MRQQTTGDTQADESPKATIETLLELIETSNRWLQKIERDSLILIVILIILPVAYAVSAMYGIQIIQAKIALLGAFFIPGVIIGIIVFLALIALLIRRHLAIRKEIKRWQERLRTLHKDSEELLEKL